MEVVAIIGGGAGGILAAIAAAEEARRLCRDVSIHIYEASDKIGRSILASGNGRCNFSNSHIDSSLYRNGDFVDECMTCLDNVLEETLDLSVFPNSVVAWFAAHGLAYMEESEGRLYPRANKSSAVLDVLKFAIDKFNIDVHLDAKVSSIDPREESSDHLTMRMEDGAFERADKVILACGGKVSKQLVPDNAARYLETLPILCPLKFDSAGRKISKRLENIRVKCSIELLRNGKLVSSERGEAMFRKYGISGICTFNLSRFACKGDSLKINLFPDIDKEEAVRMLQDRVESFNCIYGKAPSAEELLNGLVLPRLGEELIAYAGLNLANPVNRDGISALAKALQDLEFKVDGPADVEHAQVQRGGFYINDVSTSTLEVKRMPGLYIIGEALDVDGPCGGYNLNWAFTTGLLAGISAVQSL